MSATFNVGHKDTLSIAYLDQNGNPMLTPVVTDSAPIWTQLTPATDSLTPAADGLSAVAVGLAVGTDVITLTVVVDGVTFSATDSLTVTAAPQVLTSVQIVDTVV